MLGNACVKEKEPTDKLSIKPLAFLFLQIFLMSDCIRIHSYAYRALKNMSSRGFLLFPGIKKNIMHPYVKLGKSNRSLIHSKCLLEILSLLLYEPHINPSYGCIIRGLDVNYCSRGKVRK